MMNLQMKDEEPSGFDLVIIVGVIGPLKIFLYSLNMEFPF